MKVEKMTHADILAYMQGQTADKVKDLRKTNPNVGILLDLVDQAKTGVNFDFENISERDRPVSFDKTEEMIQALLSGSATEADKLNFLSYLFNSYEFYQRCIMKLNQNVQLVSAESPGQLKEISIQEDDQLIENFIADKPPQIDISYKIPIKFWDRIKESVTVFGLRGRRWAYATAALAVFLSSYFGVRFYNTTYQLILAENLLEENYRVYVIDTPRLSGAYAPTGISTLLSEETEEKSYLEEANQLSQDVLEYDREYWQANLLQAKIQLINNELKSAIEILQALEKNDDTSAQLFNDLGVAYFNSEMYEQSADYYRRAIKLDPGFNAAHYNLALCLIRMSRENEAMQILENYLGIEKDEGWYNAALQLYNNLKTSN